MLPPNRRGAHGTLLLGLALSGFALGCGTSCFDAPPSSGDTEVRLVNAGTRRLDSVTVHVTGASYHLGPLLAGDSVTVATRPTGETAVHIRHAGRSDSLYLGVYFEAGYGGRVRAEITADTVTALQSDFDFGVY